MKPRLALFFICLICPLVFASPLAYAADDLVVALTLNGLQVADGLTVLERDHGPDRELFLPLADILDALEIHRDVQPGAKANSKTISGWFLNESRIYSLDTELPRAFSDGREQEVTKDDIQVVDKVIYVSQAFFTRFMPLVFSLDRKQSVLVVQPKEKLPLQTRMERESKRKNGRFKSYRLMNYPVKDIPYDGATFPALDLNLNGGYDQNSGWSNAYTIQAGGDLAYSGLEATLTGDQGRELRELRLSLGRESDDGGVYEVSRLTQVRVGDTTVPGINLLTNPRTERGVLLSTAPVAYRSEFDRTIVEGSASPGFEAELYRGEELLDYQIVGQDGHYAFVNVPLVIGRNDFRVMVYGPQGQSDEFLKTVRIEDGLLPSGKDGLRIQATDAGYSMGQLIGFNNDNSPVPHQLAYDLQYDVGLTESVTVGVLRTRAPNRQTLLPNTNSQSLLVFRPQFDLQTENVFAKAQSSVMASYTGAGVRVAALNSFWRLDGIADDTGGSGGEVSVLSGYQNWTVSAARAEFHNLLTALNVQNGDVMQSRSRGRVAAGLNLIAKTHLDFDIQLEHRAGVFGSTYDLANFRASTRLGPVRVVNNWFDNWTHLTDGTTASQTIGDFEASTRRELTDFTVGVSYDTSLKWSATDYRAQIATDEFLKSRFEVGYTQHISTKSNTYALGWAKNFNSYRAGFQGRWNNFLGWTVLALVNFGVAKKPDSNDYFLSSESLATVGMVQPSYFLSRDSMDGKPAIHEPIEKVELNVNGQPRTTISDRPVRDIVRGLAVNQKSELSVVQGTLTDPYWAPENQGVSIIPRKGRIFPIEFKIIEEGEVEGYVRDHGKTLTGVTVELMDETGGIVQSGKTSYDGAFYFRFLRPGPYVVRLGEGQDRKYQDLRADPVSFVVTYDQLGVFDIDLIIQ